MRSFYFVVKMAYLLPLTRKIVLAVLFWYYPAPIFLAEHGKYNFLTTKNVMKIANG